jgi:hypothetical protein
MKVAQYEVRVSVFKKASVPDARGTDVSFWIISQHFVLGYFRKVPAGLIFSNPNSNPITTF